MVADVLMHIVKMSDRFDSKIARESTWVQHVTDNFCVGVLAKHTAKVRCDSETIYLSDLVERHLASGDEVIRVGEALAAIQRVIEHTSDPVREIIAAVLEPEFLQKSSAAILAYVERDREFLNEFVAEMVNASVTYEDFVLVLRYAVS